MSLIRRQRAPRTPPPHIVRIPTLNIKGLCKKKALSRIIPYPPNFNRTPAKIIDPATGASTWALGSHR